MPGPYHVGVVGCGVAGAATALFLARAGHRVTVVEQAPELGAAGAGILLQMSGQAVLRRLGLLDRVTAHAAPLTELYARHDTGRDLVTNRYTDYDPGCRAYGVHRGVIFGAVLAALRTEPVEIRQGQPVLRREVKGGRVFLHDAAGAEHGPFDFVVAADGSRSRFRAACRLRAYVHAYSHGTLWLTAPGDGVPGKLLQVVRGTEKLFGLLPLGDGLCTMYWGLRLADYGKIKARGLGALKREILAFAPEAAGLLDLLHDFEQLLVTGYRHVWMPWVHDRHTLFLGDAAHAMSPHLGQGMNLALVDAARLADCLAEAPDPPAAFRLFRARQRAYLRYYAAVTFFLSPFFHGDYPLLGWGRDVVLPLLPRVPWVKRQMLMTVCGLKGGFLRGRVPG